MNKREYNKVSELVAQGEQLQAEVYRLEKFAMLICNQECNPEIKIRMDGDKVEEVKIARMAMVRWLEIGGTSGADTPEEKEFVRTKETFAEKLTDKETLQLIGILIASKKDKMKELYQKLNKLGLKL